MKITDEALEAAHIAANQKANRHTYVREMSVRAALEAALPHLSQGAPTVADIRLQPDAEGLEVVGAGFLPSNEQVARLSDAERVISEKEAEIDKLRRFLRAARNGEQDNGVRAEAAEARVAELVKALEFYADVSKYPSPLTGGMGALWQDCGQRARNALGGQSNEA